ncbi:MAG: hypothetical protein WKF70_10175 [Chitinophagaceae bacterium]
MNLSPHILRRKLTTLLFITVSVAAFATLGNGGGRKNVISTKSLLSHIPSYNYKNFSLKTGYQYRGISIFSAARVEGKYIQMNALVTYQKGNSTYILPLKKKHALSRIKFSPAALSR